MLIVTLHSELPAGGDVPEWVHLVPAGSFSGADGRGPYHVRNAAAVIAASMKAVRLPIDENHSIDLKAPKGEPSPARGWVVGLQERADGIWGRVEWTEEGRRMVAAKDYRGISPAIARTEGGEIIQVLRASLTNTPNLTQLATLHSRSLNMDLLAQLRLALGLGANAPETDVLAAVTTNKTVVDTHSASLKAIAKAAGLSDALAADGIVTELQARQVGGDAAATQLRNTVVELQNQLTTLQNDTAKKEATRVIDAGIAAGKTALVSLRDYYIDRHMKDPAGVEKEIGAMVSIHSGGLPRPRVDDKDSPAANLTDDELRTCELMGINPAEFAKTAKLQKELL